jgi:hypothetical protein
MKYSARNFPKTHPTVTKPCVIAWLRCTLRWWFEKLLFLWFGLRSRNTAMKFCAAQYCRYSVPEECQFLKQGPGRSTFRDRWLAHLPFSSGPGSKTQPVYRLFCLSSVDVFRVSTQMLGFPVKLTTTSFKRNGSAQWWYFKLVLEWGCSVRTLVGALATLISGLSWLSSIPPRKCRDITSSKPRPLPSRYFPFYYSSILPFDTSGFWQRWKTLHKHTFPSAPFFINPFVWGFVIWVWKHC